MGCVGSWAHGAGSWELGGMVPGAGSMALRSWEHGAESFLGNGKQQQLGVYRRIRSFAA